MVLVSPRHGGVWVALAFAAALASVSACGDSGNSLCQGYALCVCYANMTCNEGLRCMDGLCTDPMGQGGAANSGGSSSTSGGSNSGGSSSNSGGSRPSTGGSNTSGGSDGVGGSNPSGGSVSDGGSNTSGGSGNDGGSNASGGSVSDGGSNTSGGSGNDGGSNTGGSGGAPPDPNNLILNGDFSQGELYWNLEDTPTTDKVENGIWCVNFVPQTARAIPGWPEAVGMALSLSGNYIFSFKALSTTEYATVTAKVGRVLSPYTADFQDTFTPPSDLTQFIYTFSANDPQAGVVFDISTTSGGTICIDDVVVKPAP
jgi:hypothetical protein